MASVAAHKASLGKPAKCFECGLAYKVPPGAERLASDSGPRKGGTNKERSLQAQVDNLQKRLAEANVNNSDDENHVTSLVAVGAKTVTNISVSAHTAHAGSSMCSILGRFMCNS